MSRTLRSTQDVTVLVGTKKAVRGDAGSCHRAEKMRNSTLAFVGALLFPTSWACDGGGREPDPATDSDSFPAGTSATTSMASAGTSSTEGESTEGTVSTSSAAEGEDSSSAGDPTESGSRGSATTGEPVVCDPPTSLSVLFVGNSFTFTHDLPSMVTGLGRSAGLPITTDSITQGGQRLSYHVQNEDTLPLIESQTWDYVVLQGHSLETIDDLEGFLQNGQTLVDWIESAGAKPLLYETWARSPIHTIYNEPGFPYSTPDEMQEAVSAGYEELSALTGGRVVPAGQAWQALWSSDSIGVVYPWGPDEYHPSIAGTYLNASVFFLAMTGLSLDALEGEQPVDEETVAIVHAFAQQVVPPCR